MADLGGREGKIIMKCNENVHVREGQLVYYNIFKNKYQVNNYLNRISYTEVKVSKPLLHPRFR